MLFHNIIKKLVSNLSNSQRIRRTTSLSMEMCVRSQVTIPSQNHVNRQEAVRARSSQSPSQRSQMPRAARARISQCQQLEFFCHFIRLPHLRDKEWLSVSLQVNIPKSQHTKQPIEFAVIEPPKAIMELSIIIMPPCQKANQKAAVRSMSISSDFPPSVGDIPDRDPLRANLCCDYLKVIMYARVKRRYRRCELSGGVGIL